MFTTYLKRKTEHRQQCHAQAELVVGPLRMQRTISNITATNIQSDKIQSMQIEQEEMNVDQQSISIKKSTDATNKFKATVGHS